MYTQHRRAVIHRGLRWTLVALFILQGTLKVVMFLMPGAIAWFEAAGMPGWLPASVVALEMFLIVQFGLGMAGYYQAPPDPAKESEAPAVRA